MAYYLQMNGAGDYLKLPSMALTRIVADTTIRRRTDFNRVIWDFRTGIGFSYLQQTTGGLDTWGSGTVKVDTVTKTNSTVAIPDGTRCTIDHTLSLGTDDGNIFTNNSVTANTFISGDIYDLKIYNGATLVAHYDMTLGNVQDQTGNGNNATLTGGTWVSDATGTTQTGASSVQGVSTITAAATVIPAAITGSASLQGVATVSATANIINASMVGSASLPSVGMVTATASVILSGSASLTGVSTVTALAAGLNVPGSASLVGVSWISVTGTSGANISRIINLLASMAESIQLSAENAITINLQASWSNALSLSGSIPDTVALEGGLMTKTKQDFTMYAGDTPPFTITMTDSTNLSGATVKWGLRRGHVKGPQVLLKTSQDGGLSASGSVVTINLLNSDTSALDGQFYHEAEVTDISGKVSTIMTGNITIQPSGV